LKFQFVLRWFWIVLYSNLYCNILMWFKHLLLGIFIVIYFCFFDTSWDLSALLSFLLWFICCLLFCADDIRQTLIATSFQLSYGITNVIKIIVETHIKLSAPIAGDEDYINRKGYQSVLLQVYFVLSNYTCFHVTTSNFLPTNHI
jgi:hypothetical protein